MTSTATPRARSQSLGDLPRRTADRYPDKLAKNPSGKILQRHLRDGR